MITKTKDVCGSDACIETSRIPVWAIIECLLLGWKHEEIFASLPSVTESQISECQAYYQNNKAEIDDAIRMNQV